MKILILTILLFYSCENSENADYLWEQGKILRSEGSLQESITLFKKLIHKFPNNILAAEAQFQIADIYLNDSKDYEFALKEFNIVLNKYNTHIVAKKSLFMLGYINNNYINNYTKAINYYNQFLEKFPDDELIPSVEYELKGLESINSVIDSLNNINL